MLTYKPNYFTVLVNLTGLEMANMSRLFTHHEALRLNARSARLLHRFDPLVAPPVEPVEDAPGFIKHVLCQGAKWHKVTNGIWGEHCSEPNCIINQGAPKHQK